MARVLRMRWACDSPLDTGERGLWLLGPGLLYGYNPSFTVIDGVLDRSVLF